MWLVVDEQTDHLKVPINTQSIILPSNSQPWSRKEFIVEWRPQHEKHGVDRVTICDRVKWWTLGEAYAQSDWLMMLKVINIHWLHSKITQTLKSLTQWISIGGNLVPLIHSGWFAPLFPYKKLRIKMFRIIRLFANLKCEPAVFNIDTILYR